MLIVVWTLALLALLAVSLGGDARSGTRLVRNLAEAARARALAEAGMTLALSDLLSGLPRSAWRTGTALREFAYDGGRVQLRIEDEGGKVDLLAAPYELVTNLLDRIDLTDDERAMLRDAINQRRGAPEQRNPGLDSGEAGAANGPRQPPFEAIEALVPDKTFHVAERLVPYATVYTHSAQVDPMTAPREVLLAVPGLDPSTVDEMIAARSDPAQPPQPIPLAAAPYLGASQLPVVRLHAQAVTASGATAMIETVAVLSGQPQAPFRLMLWRKEFGIETAAAP